MSTKAIRKNLYISNDVIRHLENQANQSKYVSDLIRKDRDNCTVLTREDVIKVMTEYLPTLQLSNISVNSYSPASVDCSEDISSSIDGILSQFPA